MTKKERAKLRAEMSKMIAALLSKGERVTTSQICEMTIERFPDLIEAAREKLFRKSLTEIARNLLKEANKGQKEELQVNLFGNSLPRLSIPRCVALPPAPGEREMIWTPITKATLSEISQYAGYLRKGARADLAKARKIDVFHDYVLSIAETDDIDTPIEEMLRGLAASDLPPRNWAIQKESLFS